MYVERPSRVPGAVLWTAVTDGVPSRVLPDGCMDLIAIDGSVFVAGPDTTARLSSSALGTTFTGLRFAPGFGPRVVGVPAHELINQLVPLDAVWRGQAVSRVVDELVRDPGEALEDAALAACRDADDVSAWVEDIVGLVRWGASVGRMATETAVSPRQFQRRCNDAFGYGARTLGRIFRMQRAVALAQQGVGFGEVAVRAGYADQPHLSREVRALAGVPLGQLVSSGANRSTELPSGSWTTA